jgi:outer membrane protein assembly factor BamD (BamD/ComL family)
MSDFDQSQSFYASYEQHPLYSEAVKLMADGDEVAAMEALERLSELYPDEQAVQDLLLRIQLKTTFGDADYIRVEHAQPTPVLRTVVMLMLGLTACLVLVTGLAAAYNRWWEPRVRAQEQEDSIEALWADVNRRLNAGDLSGAREILQVLYTQSPNDPAIQDTLNIIEQRQAWANLFADAVFLREKGDWQGALDLFYQIPEESPDHGRAQAIIQELLDQVALDTAWQDVQNLLLAEDWQAAVTTLSWIREQAPGYRRAEVEEYLYQFHARLAMELLSQTDGDANSMREAIYHLGEALVLRPTDEDLIEEKRLAVGYIAGAEANDRGDWVAVIVRWEPVYNARPDYLGGTFKQQLDEAYPLAAKQLISEANGSLRLLSQAAGYLETALLADPENEELTEELRLVTLYLKGLEAFREESLNLAVDYWGAIYAVRPGYQNGVLEENLRLACANSPTADEELCPEF